MGLYDTRLAELSEAAGRGHRRVGRRGVSARQPERAPARRFAPPPAPSFARPSRPSTPPPAPRPFERSFARRVGEVPYVARAVDEAAKRRRPPMDVQSLLFSRADGWTAGKAKQWAKSHGYKHGKVDVTDQYIRIRQFDPKGLKIKRTIPFGQGIKAVVAREEVTSMATTKEAARRRRRPARKAREAATKEAPRRRRRRTTREAPAATVAAPRRRRRRTTREAPAATVAAPRRRRRRAAREASHVMEAKRPRRRPRRRAATRTREAWHGDRAGHRKAAKKGAARRKRRRYARESSVVAEAPRRRRRARRKTREANHMMEARRPRRRRARHARTHEVQAPRRRRRSSRRRSSTHETPRRYRRHARRSNPFSGAELAIAIGTGALGFVAADFLDRFLATYDPAATGTKPTDRFTSDGAGTLANTLNVASTPGLVRGGAAVAMAVVPLVGSLFIDQPYVRSSLEGFGIGAAINAVKLLVNNVLMPLFKPKDTSTAGLQGSFIARLYPAEVAASINMAAAPTAGQPAAVSSGGGSGALSGSDVGPFALSAESPYPDAAQALRRQAGMSGPGNQFPTVQNVWGTGEFPTTAQAMGVGQATADATQAVMQALPGIHPSAAVQAAGAAIAHPHNIHGALVLIFPHIPTNVLMECARQVAPHVARVHAAASAPNVPVATAPVPPMPTVPGTTSGLYGVGQTPAAPPPATGQPMAVPLTAVPVQSVPMGPPSLPVPGPRMNNPEHAPQGCACLSDDNPFLGFVGDAEEDTLFDSGSRRAA